MVNNFEKELQVWMQNILNPYCLNECKISCCDCEGAVQIDRGYEKLFQIYRKTGKPVKVKKENQPGEGLFKGKHNGIWYFEGGACPNYDKENKKCLIHNQYPRCTLYPLLKVGKTKGKNGYSIFSVCSLHKLKESQEPLKSLIELARKHNLKIYKEEIDNL